MEDNVENTTDNPNRDLSRRKRRYVSIGNDATSSSTNIEREQNNMASRITCQPHHAEQLTISVHLGSLLKEIPQSTFLSSVWSDGLDSLCMGCGKPFESDGGPPIRTIGFELTRRSPEIPHNITQNLVVPYHIRIFNRHFACIKAENINYVPVSHAWHENVATAQNKRHEDINISRLVYQTVVRSLLALTKQNGRECEIWHDYLSVPQWRYEVQQKLLLEIPTIFNYPRKTIIHLHDVRAMHLHDVQAMKPSNLHEKSIRDKFCDGLFAIIRSQWFERMWVTLEYIQSNETIILAEDFSICDTNARKIFLAVKAVIFEGIRNCDSERLRKDIQRSQAVQPTIVSWRNMETWKNQHDNQRTIGFAIAILGRKKFREERDYYLALGAMLDFKPKQNSLTLVKNTFQYFLILMLQALDNGDYTPLLFTPLEGEYVHPRAPWLHGYPEMSGNSWDLGACHRKSGSQQIIRNGKIMPELESVGITEYIQAYDFVGAPDSVFGHVVSMITQASGTCPKAFSSAMNRIFPRPERKAFNTEQENAGHENPMDTGQEYDMARLGQLLKESVILQNQAESHESTQKKLLLSKQIIDMLNLDSRLELAFAEAKRCSEVHKISSECLGRVSCLFCGRRSMFRLTLWKVPPPKNTQVYRIPGLLYDESIPEGIGLLILDQKIVGRMIYGTPACECHVLQLVDLGIANH